MLDCSIVKTCPTAGGLLMLRYKGNPPAGGQFNNLIHSKNKFSSILSIVHITEFSFKHYIDLLVMSIVFIYEIF